MKPVPVLNPRILLVDHNRDGLLVRRALLEEAGCTVEIAIDGEEGLKLFEAADFDVVVTNHRLPRMTGTELIQRIRRGNPNARIILLSGFVEPLGLTEESTGADAVIAKSSSEAAHLVRWVKRLANRAPARKPPGAQKAARVRVRKAAD
jgi:CheY-like chemotaxis protein